VPSPIADEIDGELRAAGSPERAARERTYLKSQLDHYGASVPVIRSVAKRIATRLPDLGHDEMIDVVDALWIEPVHERRVAAVELLDLYVDRLRTDDADLLERLLRESRTWALLDGLAASVVGPLAERYEEMGTVLDRWARDDDFWIRRAALLAHLVALRRGDGDFARFSRYADEMLDDREFFIRKAIGWVLRDTARKRPDLVYDWLLPRASRASSLTIREAIKPMSEQQRTAIVATRAPASRSQATRLSNRLDL
jgi:3-methyladenine DNA glycosylase AlkD